MPAVLGAHTQGRSLAQAMNRIREALSLWADDAHRAELPPVIHLPAAARTSVRRALKARERAERAEQEASRVVRDSIRELTQHENLSTRDIAALLGLSPSRVDQLKPRPRSDRVARRDASAGWRVTASTARKATARRAASAKRRTAAKKR